MARAVTLPNRDVTIVTTNDRVYVGTAYTGTLTELAKFLTEQSYSVRQNDELK